MYNDIGNACNVAAFGWFDGFGILDLIRVLIKREG